jgi:hypothetical protein
MVLDACFKRGSATQNRLTPLIPLRGDIATGHRCEYVKVYWPPSRGQGGDSIGGRVDAREFAALGEMSME